jgi:hypothetical protein
MRDGLTSADSLARSDWNRLPAKPTLNAGIRDRNAGVMTEDETRETDYRTVFSGGCGIGFDPDSSGGRDSGTEIHPAVPAYLLNLKRLMLSRPFFDRIPDPGMVELDLVSPSSATRGSNGRYAFVYFNGPGKTQQVLTDRLTGNRLNAWWFNPSDGKTYDTDGRRLDRPFAAIEKKDRTFKSPQAGRDWVLVLDDAVFSFPVPGEPMNEHGSQ